MSQKMASMGRQLTRSVVCHIRQPRWNRLLLNSHINLHLLPIYQQKMFSKKSEKLGCDPRKMPKKKKNCTDYKKNPCIAGDKPKKMPNLKPISAQIRITRRRKFLQDKKCKELEAKNKCDDDPCASFSGATLIRGRHRVRFSMSWNKVNGCLLYLSRLRSPVNLHQERMFSKKVEKKECSAAEAKPKPPVPPKNSRIVRKRNHLLAMKQREAEARAKAKTPAEIQKPQEPQNIDEAFDQLKEACTLNTQTKECEQKQFKSLCEDLKTSKSKGEATPTDSLIKCMLTGIKKACALHAEKMLFEQKYAKEIAAEKAAKLEAKLALAKREGTPPDCSKPQKEKKTKKISPAEEKKAKEETELRRLLKEIKEKCKKKRDELEAKCRKKAEEAALKKKCEEAKAKKKCEEAEARKKCEEAEAKKKCEEAEAKRKCEEAEAKKKCEEAEARKKCEEAEAKRKCEEAEAKKKCEEAEAKKKCEKAEAKKKAEAEAKRKCEEAEAKRKCEEAEAKKKCEEAEARKKCEEAEAKRKCEEAEAKRKCEEAEAKKKCEEAEARKKYEEAVQKKKCEEAEAKRKCEEAEAQRKCEEAKLKKLCEEEEAKAKKREEAKRKKQCEEARLKKQSDAVASKIKCKTFEKKRRDTSPRCKNDE